MAGGPRIPPPSFVSRSCGMRFLADRFLWLLREAPGSARGDLMMPAPLVRVLIVDDHALVRAGLRGLLEIGGEIKVVGEASSSEEACRVMLALAPDVIILDISLPGVSGIEAIGRFLRILPGARILILSMHESEPFPGLALERGALGYLSKRGAPEELVIAVRRVAEGQRYLGNSVAQQVAMTHLRKNPDSLSALTSRELEVFLLLARGQSVNAIAAALYLSPKTVHAHRANVLRKLEIRSIAELVAVAVRSGVIDVHGEALA
jgi:two-component system, NarL family, invasion response regulator UvrY